MDISKVTNDELRQEIEKRKIAETKPKPLTIYTNPDVAKFQKLCSQYIDSLAGEEYFKDHEYYIFEAAIELFYGKDVWDWINERTDEMDM